MAQTIENFIDGRFVPPVAGEYLDDVEPATGLAYAKVASSDARDIEAAVAAAKRAFPDWSGMAADQRSAILFRIADLIDQNREQLARAESMDQGKPLWLTREMDIPRAAANFRFFAGAV